MKLTAVLFSALFLSACNQNADNTNHLQAQVDSLQSQLKNSYTPGMGELMSNIQLHHAKLWFAGDNQNWALAKYEESLIISAFKKIQQYHADKPEAKIAAMINPALDSVDLSIDQKNKVSFKRGFLFLTTTCNSCHQATKKSFNVIVTPTQPPISNQLYK
jgi:cytochrome c1